MSLKLRVYPDGIERDVEVVGYVHGQGKVANDVHCIVRNLYTGEEYRASAKSIYIDNDSRATPIGFGWVA